MDVLCCVVLGYGKVKDIMRILNQPQSTVSEKLRFLKKGKVVKKKKWKFEVNWNSLYKIFYTRVREQFGMGLIEAKRPTKAQKQEMAFRKKLLKIDLEKHMPEALVKNLLINYSYLLLDGYPKLSLAEVIEKFLDQLPLCDGKQLNELDKHYNSRLVKLKKLLRYRMSENEFFFDVLVNPVTKETYGKDVREDLNRKIYNVSI